MTFTIELKNKIFTLVLRSAAVAGGDEWMKSPTAQMPERYILRHFIIISCFILSVGHNYASAQTTTEKVKQLIDSLSWNSISMDCMGGMLVLTHSDKTEQQLLSIGKEATTQLIYSLDDKSKTVMAHIILTQLWEPQNGQNFLGTKYIYKECNNLIGWHHVYNGLVWDWHENTDQTIEQKEIDKIKTYWTSKLIDKRPTQNLNTQAIFDELEKQDESLFPCNKVYDNNSASIKSSELFSLLNKKSDDPLFQELWIRFGNDSTVSSYSDCFFITYGPEGLSFRFEKDSVLSTIFVDNSYTGELPYGLKLTDHKASVEKKIGKPFKSSKYVENTSNWYKQQNLFLDFDKNGKIIKFGISTN